jgi:hypothetical protein
MQRREIATALIASTTAAVLAPRMADAQSCSAPCWAQTTLESQAGVTPYQQQYWPGDIRRYKAASDSDYTNAIQRALQVPQDVYIPAGTWPISSALNVLVNNGANRRIYGEGMEVSVIQVIGANTDAFTVSSGAAYLRITMEDLQISNSASSGTGNGVYFGGSPGGTGVLVYESIFKNVWCTVPGRAFYLPNVFSTQLVNCQGSSATSNVFELGGGTAVTLKGCYAHNVPTNHWAYRLYCGAFLDSCNGIDSGGGDWGCFGSSTADGDPFDQSFSMLLINCNIEDFNNNALYFRTDGYAKLIQCNFLAKAAGSYNSEIYVEYCDQGISLDSCEFATKGAARNYTSPIYVLYGAQLLCTNTFCYDSVHSAWNRLTNFAYGSPVQYITLGSCAAAGMASGADQSAAHFNSLAATQLYNYYSGAQVLSGGAATVSFSKNQFDNNYLVLLTGNANENFFVANVSPGGFQIRSSNSSSSATVNWFIARNSPAY